MSNWTFAGISNNDPRITVNGLMTGCPGGDLWLQCERLAGLLERCVGKGGNRTRVISDGLCGSVYAELDKCKVKEEPWRFEILPPRGTREVQIENAINSLRDQLSTLSQQVSKLEECNG